MTSLKNRHTAGKLVFLILFNVGLLSSQDNPAVEVPISSIIVIGNEQTGENVITRELLFKEGDRVTRDILEQSRQRIMNLHLFNRVEMQVIPQDDDTHMLLIDVTERLYFYPVPILTMRERDWSKWSYGLSVVHKNFRGQNERLWAGVWFGYRPGFGVTYTNPWLGDSLHLTASTTLSKTTFNHRIFNFEERHIFGELKLGKFWGRYFQTELGINVDRINVDDDAVQYMRSNSTTEVLVGLQLALKYDTRNLYSYPSRGFLSQLNILKNGFFSDYNDYNRIDLDLRTYKTLGILITSLRFYQSYIFGDVPVYRINYIGFEERIRGHFYTEKSGRHINLGSIEFRFPLIPIRYLSVEVPPIPALYTKNLKYGLSAGIFADAGIIWVDPEQYSIMNVMSGFGFGLHIHLPYIEIFRIDYAFDMNLRGQIIVEVGIAF